MEVERFCLVSLLAPNNGRNEGKRDRQQLRVEPDLSVM